MAAENMSELGLGLAELRSPAALRGALGELIGTLLLVLIGAGSFVGVVYFQGSEAVPVIALAQGLTFAILVAGLSGISNGYMNPAVTFAMVITGQISVMRGVMYIIAQLFGAVLGALLLRALVLNLVLNAVPGGGGLVLSDPAVSEAWKGMILEALGTFILVWTIFAVAVNKRNVSGNVAPLYIGLAVAAAGLFLVPLTGSGLNPARSFGPALALPGTGDGVPGRWDDWWIYWVGPLLGAAVAGLGYYVLYLMTDDE